MIAIIFTSAYIAMTSMDIATGLSVHRLINQVLNIFTITG